VTDATIQSDYNVAVIQQQQRELEEMRRDLRSLWDVVRRLRNRRQVVGSLPETPAFEYGEEQLRQALMSDVSRELSMQLGSAFAGISTRLENDNDLGGEVLCLEIALKVGHAEFATLRRQALSVFDAATRDRDTSRIVLSVRRRD
jgi:hypothetical protein